MQLGVCKNAKPIGQGATQAPKLFEYKSQPSSDLNLRVATYSSQDGQIVVSVLPS